MFACDIPAVAASGSTPINTFPQNVEVLSQVRFGGSTTYINYDSGIPALQMYIGSILSQSLFGLPRPACSKCTDAHEAPIERCLGQAPQEDQGHSLGGDNNN